MTSASQDEHLSQLDKFKEAARDLECDEDEVRSDATLKKVAKQKGDKATSEDSEGQ